MMSHSHSHPQPPQCLKHLLHEHPESSFSTSQAILSSFSSCPIQFQTSTSATSSSLSHSFFDPKLFSSPHQYFDEDHDSTPFSCCFNVSSKRWGTLKLGCSDASAMASQVDFSLRSPSEIRKKKITGQKKREELEKEVVSMDDGLAYLDIENSWCRDLDELLSKTKVSMLQSLLDQEEKIHEILEMVHNRPDGSAISIPNFLPPKIKEILTELVMVESEIARLEGQISQLQDSLKHEQQVNKESKSKAWNQGNLSNSSNHLSTTAPIPIPTPLHRSLHERMAFETKALHFISKAIKGDYDLNHFSFNEKTGYLKNYVEQKENHLTEDYRFPRKSGMVKPASPLRDPRHPSPKPRERNLEMCLDLPTKSLLDPLLSEENDLKWQPNKLSESIMKCLNFIYVRLLRTSRAMELEKSGPISRSIHSSLSSRSFRVDTGLNPKSSLALQRESRQQDPYGIFNAEESIPRDIGPYKNLVIFTSSSMDPKFISSPSSIPLLRKLRVLMSNLQTVDLRGLTYQQKLAFWINMYNACIMHGFLQYGVPSTPEKLLALINKATLNVGGNTINAQAIEHFILKKRSASNIKEVHGKSDEWEEKELAVRELYGLESMDPNVIFSLCCGTRSSPAVRIYTADSVAAELEKSKLDYLQASIMVTSLKKIAFPELLLRNMLDFAIDTESLVEWVCDQLPTSGTLRKSMVDCFRGHNNPVKASTIVEKIPYDYEFQYLLAI